MCLLIRWLIQYIIKQLWAGCQGRAVSQPEWCVKLREVFLEFFHTTRLWNGLEISSVCSPNRSQHLSSPGSRLRLPPLFPPLSRPPFLGSVYLLIWGWSCTQSESGLGSQSGLLWGIPGDKTHNPSWKRIFQKIPFDHSVVTAPFSVHVKRACPGVCFARNPVQSALLLSPPIPHPPTLRDWEKNLQKEPGLMETSFPWKP